MLDSSCRAGESTDDDDREGMRLCAGERVGKSCFLQEESGSEDAATVAKRKKRMRRTLRGFLKSCIFESGNTAKRYRKPRCESFRWNLVRDEFSASHNEGRRCVRFTLKTYCGKRRF